MKFSLLQFKRQTVASWSLLLVAMVVVVCFSQNLGLSHSCPSAPRFENSEQLLPESQSVASSECSSSEHLINAFAANLELALPLFILALVIIATLLKQTNTTHLFIQPNSYMGVRRHLAFCTFQE